MKRRTKIFGITIVALALVFAAINFQWSRAQLDKFREFGSLTRTVDLSDREPSLSIRETVQQSDLVEGCRLNFSSTPCDMPETLYLRNEMRRSDDPRLSDLTFLSHTYVNLLSVTLRSRNPDYVSPLGLDYECEPDEFEAYLSWANQMRAESLDSSGLIVVFPEKLWHCQRRHNKTHPTPDHTFWLWVEGNAVGRIDCSKSGDVPNPGCRSNLFLDMGDSRFSVGMVPAVNVTSYVSNLSSIFVGFMSPHSAETAGINHANYFTTQFEVSEEAAALMAFIEEELK